MRKFALLSLLGLLAFNACDNSIEPSTVSGDSFKEVGRFLQLTYGVKFYGANGEYCAVDDVDLRGIKDVCSQAGTDNWVDICRWDWMSSDVDLNRYEQFLTKAGIRIKRWRNPGFFIDDIVLCFYLGDVVKIEKIL